MNYKFTTIIFLWLLPNILSHLKIFLTIRIGMFFACLLLFALVTLSACSGRYSLSRKKVFQLIFIGSLKVAGPIHLTAQIEKLKFG